MKYYHGSPVCGLKILKPFLSNHKNKYVYLSTNEAVALFYTVRTDWYTYGFDKETGLPVYTEYYKDQLRNLYFQKQGSVYEADSDALSDNPTNIKCAFVVEHDVPVESEKQINNLYDTFIEYEKEHKLIIRRNEDLTADEMMKINKIVIGEINNNLANSSREYSKFLKEKFPELWEKCLMLKSKSEV